MIPIEKELKLFGRDATPDSKRRQFFFSKRPEFSASIQSPLLCISIAMSAEAFVPIPKKISRNSRKTWVTWMLLLWMKKQKSSRCCNLNITESIREIKSEGNNTFEEGKAETE